MSLLNFKPFQKKRSRRWWAFSILAHGALIMLLGQIMFRFPLGQLMGLPKHKIQQERLTYIELQRPAGAGTSTKTAAPQPASPAPLQAPRTTPSDVSAPPPLDTMRSRASGGRGTGLNDAGSGIASGVTPRLPDPRIPLAAGEMHIARSNSEMVDSVISLAIGIVNDSLALAAQRRKPGDWSVKGKDGKVWGWDQQGNIRLGKFTIPGALLALLPLNAQNPMSPIDQRVASFVRSDIQFHAQRAISEDEFRAAIKRIRERKDKERRARTIVTADSSDQR